MRRINSTLYIVILAFISFQCLPKFDEPVAPQWDTQLTLPIMDTSYTLADLITKDTSVIKIDSATKEILYKTSSPANPSTVGDALIIHPESTPPIEMQIGPFRVQTPNEFSNTIQIFDTIPAPPPPFPDTMTLPARDTSFMQQLATFSEFEFVKIASGSIRLKIKNNLPVAISFPEPVRITNVEGGTSVASFSALGTILPGDSAVAFENLNDTIKNSLQLYVHVLTNSQLIQLPLGEDRAKISFSMEILNAVATAAKAKIPQQDVTGIKDSADFFTDSTSQPTLVQSATFREGTMFFIVENFVDLNIGIKLKLGNFTKRIPPYDTLVIDNQIPRLDSLVVPIDMQEYQITFPAGATNKFIYEARISNLDSANSFRVIHSSDLVRTYIRIPTNSNFVLQSVQGKVAPFESAINETLTVDLADVDPHFSGNIRFSGFNVDLGLFVGGGVKTALDMKIIGMNENTGVIDSIFIPAGQDTIFPNVLNTINLVIDQFLASFAFPDLPNKFIMKGVAKFNPNYELGFIADTTSLFGTIDFTIPLKLGIDNAQFIDTSEVETNFDKENLGDVNYGNISFAFDNNLPVGITFAFDMVDSVWMSGDTLHGTNFHQQFTIDSSYASQGLPSRTLSKIEVFNNDAQDIANGDFIIFRLLMHTSGNNVVTFHSTDNIRIRVTTNLSYRVNGQDNVIQPKIVHSTRKGE
jgi:hypothetical protein